MYYSDIIANQEAKKLSCPFKMESCSGLLCMAWRLSDLKNKLGKYNDDSNGYCKLINPDSSKLE